MIAEIPPGEYDCGSEVVWGPGLASTTCSSAVSGERRCPWEEARGKEVKEKGEEGSDVRVSLRSWQAGFCLVSGAAAVERARLLRAKEQLDLPLKQKKHNPICFSLTLW